MVKVLSTRRSGFQGLLHVVVLGKRLGCHAHYAFGENNQRYRTNDFELLFDGIHDDQKSSVSRQIIVRIIGNAQEQSSGAGIT